MTEVRPRRNRADALLLAIGSVEAATFEAGQKVAEKGLN